MIRRDQHLVKPRGTEEDRVVEMKRRHEEEKRELEQEEKTAAKQHAMAETNRSRRSSRENIGAESSAPGRKRRSSKLMDPQMDPWEEMFAGPGVPSNVVRSRRSSRDLSAKVMQLQYAKFTQGQGDEPKSPRSKITKSATTGHLTKPLVHNPMPLTNPFGGDKMNLVAQAALAANKQGEAKTEMAAAGSAPDGEGAKGKLRLVAAARLVQRNRALRDADVMLQRSFLKQVRKVHTSYAAALGTDARLWRDGKESILEQIVGILACLSSQQGLLKTIVGDAKKQKKDGSDNDDDHDHDHDHDHDDEATDAADAARFAAAAARGGRRGSIQAALGAMGASPVSTAMTAAERWEMNQQLERITQAIDGVDKACEQASFEASDEQWRRVQNKAALEEAERLALELEAWTRERRSELRQFDHLQAAVTLNPEMAADSAGPSSSEKKKMANKASERRLSRVEAPANMAAAMAASIAAQRMARR